MLDRLLPRRIDHDFPGHPAALWILGLLGLAKLLMGIRSIVDGRAVATSADGIPLDRFTPEGAQTVTALFAAWGLGQALLGALCALALVRYRGMAPLVFLLLLIENVGRKAIFAVLPYASTAKTANLVVNAVFVALMLIGLALAMWRRRLPAPEA